MTSDQLDEVPEERRTLFAALAADSANRPCDFPLLGRARLSHRAAVGHTGQPALLSEGDPVLIQRVRQAGGKLLLNIFNTGDREVERLVPWEIVGGHRDVEAVDGDGGAASVSTSDGIEVVVPAHASCLLTFADTAP